MENHLIIISMIIILENFNIDIIRSRDLILFSVVENGLWYLFTITYS